jgi:hypothetical protein
MGLEVVEFIVSLEKALGLSIPDGDSAALRTPRELVRYLEPRLAAGRGERWKPQDLEAVVIGLLIEACEHDRFTLDTEFRDIFPS